MYCNLRVHVALLTASESNETTSEGPRFLVLQLWPCHRTNLEVRSRGGRPRAVSCPMLSPNKWRSARRPTIRTAFLAQLTTLEGGCLGGGRNPLAVYSGESTQECLRVQMTVWCTCRQLRSQNPFWTTRKGFFYAIGGCTGYRCSC